MCLAEVVRHMEKGMSERKHIRPDMGKPTFGQMFPDKTASLSCVPSFDNIR